MKTIEEKIEIMQHFANGGKVESSRRGPCQQWISATAPTWNWLEFDYRKKEKPRYAYLYAYKGKMKERYIVTDFFYENDEDFLNTVSAGRKLDFKKLEDIKVRIDE